MFPLDNRGGSAYAGLMQNKEAAEAAKPIGAEWCVSTWAVRHDVDGSPTTESEQVFYSGNYDETTVRWTADIEEAWLFESPGEAENVAARLIGILGPQLFEVMRADLVLREKEKRDGLDN